MTEPTAIRDRIAKLLAMAERGSNEAERAAFLDRALDLMTRYSIDRATIQAAGNEAPEAATYITVNGEKGSPSIKAKREFMVELAGIFGCRVINHGRAFQRVFGMPSDLELVQAMFQSIVLQMLTDMGHEERASFGDIGVIDRAWRVSFAHGYLMRVATRLRVQRAATVKAATVDTPGTDMVLRDRATVVNAKVAETYPKLGHARVKNQAFGDMAGFTAGATRGSTADLGGTRLAGRTGRPAVSR